eukprot:TRINITY_DN20548_c1_g1_i1.p1 TRINITY_DN20548_c1_g1~~TRINITY_DN20548_c1_g1_i1.p1  ORF type:complete len:676 (+),score=152.87 TRINITY_DN20548_c1_g1_i1:64-2091(+)
MALSPGPPVPAGTLLRTALGEDVSSSPARPAPLRPACPRKRAREGGGGGAKVGASARSATTAYAAPDPVTDCARYEARLDGHWRRVAVVGREAGAARWRVWLPGRDVGAAGGGVASVPERDLRPRQQRAAPVLCRGGEELWALGGEPADGARVLWAPQQQQQAGAMRQAGRARRLPEYVTLEGCYEQLLRAKEDRCMADDRARQLEARLRGAEREAAELSGSARRVAIRLPRAPGMREAAHYAAEAHGCACEPMDGGDAAAPQTVVVVSGPAASCAAAVRVIETRARAAGGCGVEVLCDASDAAASATPLPADSEAGDVAPRAGGAAAAAAAATEARARALREQLRRAGADAARGGAEVLRLRAELKRARRSARDADALQRLQREVERLAEDAVVRRDAHAAAERTAAALRARLADSRRECASLQRVNDWLRRGAGSPECSPPRAECASPGLGAPPSPGSSPRVPAPGSPADAAARAAAEAEEAAGWWLRSQLLLRGGDVAGASAMAGTELRAALRLQCAWRGRCARRRAAARRAARGEAAAATHLQRMWRGAEARQGVRLRQLLADRHLEIEALHRQIDALTLRLADCVPQPSPPPQTPAPVRGTPPPSAGPPAASPGRPAAGPAAAEPAPPAGSAAPGLMGGSCGLSEGAAALLEAHRAAAAAEFLGVIDGGH